MSAFAPNLPLVCKSQLTCFDIFFSLTNHASLVAISTWLQPAHGLCPSLIFPIQILLGYWPQFISIVKIIPIAIYMTWFNSRILWFDALTFNVHFTIVTNDVRDPDFLFSPISILVLECRMIMENPFHFLSITLFGWLPKSKFTLFEFEFLYVWFLKNKINKKNSKKKTVKEHTIYI